MNCTSSGCENKATFHLSWFENRRCAEEQHFCEEHARAALTTVPYAGPSTDFAGLRKAVEHATQCEIGLIVITETHDQQVVYLHAVDRRRVIPILMGIFEATSLDRKLKGYRTPRPLAHDSFAACIRLLGGELQDVVIHRLEGHMYYADARIRAHGKLLLLDVRPSDAFNLAIICDCPIFFANRVLDQTDQQSSTK